MRYKDLRDFVKQLERLGELRYVTHPLSTQLEITALCDRALRANGPALLCQHVTTAAGVRSDIPVLGNLFGTVERVALGMGANSLADLREIGALLAVLKEPTPPRGLKEMGKLWDMARAVWDMSPKLIRYPSCQEQVWEGTDLDLARLPIQTCWPGDISPLITWGLVITRGPNKRRQNLGIYRQQVIAHNKVIMRWLILDSLFRWLLP
jgi:4-hydroxy-3-polyprenylbenzoate decarboxylase